MGQFYYTHKDSCYWVSFEWQLCVPLDPVPLNLQKVDEEHPTHLQ